MPAASIPENTTTAHTVTATDIDAGDSVTFSVSAVVADGALFAIDANTGALSFIAAPDFENPGDVGLDNIYNVEVTATDTGTPGLTDVQTVAVTVTDANDAPTITSTATPSVDEGVTTVISVTSTDEDLPIQTIIYSITDGADQLLFNLDPGTGDLTFITPPDAEAPADADTNNIYEIQISATDNGTPVRNAIQNISITVIDINDPPVIESSSTPNIQENTTFVITVTASDVDIPAQGITYSVSGGADSALFTLDSISGNLSFITAPNYEIPNDQNLDNDYEIQITATDNGTTPSNLSVVQDMIVTVTDGNDAPTLISISNISIDEHINTFGGVAIGTLTTADEDALDTFTYSVTGGADAIFFSIGGTGFDELTLTDDITDYETKSSYEVVVQTTDSGTGNLTYNETITILVNDLNDAPVITSTSTPSIPENTTAVLTVTYTDEDLPAQTITYSITEGIDQALFTINDSSGDLAFITGPNFEIPTDADTDNIYEVQVTATDDGFPIASDVQDISITVTDVNESPTALNLTRSDINERIETTGGYPIGTLIGVDPDAGDSLSYSVVGGADLTNFTIGGVAFDELLIDDGFLDFETKPTYDVIVRTTDLGGLIFDRNLTIIINDVNDPPVAVDDIYTINEDTPNSVFPVLINDTDQDGHILSVSLVSFPDQGGVADISLTNDSIIYTPALNFFGTEIFTYTADDGNGGTDSATVTVTVLPVPDPPIADDLSFSTTINTDIYDFVSGSDPDGDLFAFTFPPITGSLGDATLLDMHTIDDFGKFNYHPQNGVTGVDTFTYQAWKPDPLNPGLYMYSDPATITITIYAENYSPVAYDGLLNVVMDTSAASTLSMTDANPGGSHIFSIGINGSLGTAVIDDPATGAYTYTPNPGVTGTDTFTYIVNDTMIDSNEATITVSIIDSADLMVIKRISTTLTEESNANSYYPTLSADGRYVSFNSFASNLVSGISGGQIYLYDRIDDTIELISMSDSSIPGDDTSDFSSISSDGQYVAFSSFASNLTAGDNNNRRDIFIRDRLTGSERTEVVSVSDTSELGNDTSNYPAISNDGQYVAFESVADNLVINDTNTVSDIFVHDRLAKTTKRVSISSTIGEQANRDSYKASISQDGQYIAFESSATNLIAGVTGTQIYIHNRQSGNTDIVSISSTGEEGNGRSYNPSLSANGRYVVFGSFSTNLIANDNNGVSDIFVHDRQEGITSRISVSTGGAEGDLGSSCYYQNSISADGQYIIFESDATNLVTGDTNGFKDIFVHDQSPPGETRRISTSTFGVEGNNQSWWPSISADGQVKAFSSEASNLVGNDTNNSWDVFIVHPFNN